MSTVTHEKASLLCQRCSLPFIPVRRTARFCPPCRIKLNKEQAAERYRLKAEAARPELGELEFRAPVGPEEHKLARRALGYKGVDDLLALSPTNDPFYCGTEGHLQQAAWYLDVWGRAGGLRSHIRRIHYWLTGQDNPVRADGRPYENTDACQSELNNAARWARILGYLDAEDLEDRRNDPVIVNVAPRGYEPQPSADWRDDPASLSLPYVHVPPVSLTFPRVWAQGYDYDHADRAALVELYIEKSTMSDILVPLCGELGVNLIVGKGTTSITRIIELLRRAERLGRPAHIVTICDFDPGGESMPRSIARHAQYWAQKLGIGQDISVEVVGLTREQVESYSLPPIPLKEKEARAPSFRYRHGVDGGCELDALEARHPGELARLVREAVTPWLDSDLEARLEEADEEADDNVVDRWADETSDLQEELDDLASRTSGVMDRYRDTLAQVTQMNEELESLRGELAELKGSIRTRFAETEFGLPERPEAGEPDVDTDGMLYDSRRTWQEQNAVYQRHKDGRA